MSQLSPLQLEHSVFMAFHLDFIQTEAEVPLKLGYPSFKEARFSTESSIEPIPPENTPEGAGANPYYVVNLTVDIEPKDAEKPLFPYKAKVVMSGIFTTSLPAEKRDALVLVNGSSLLYSAIREQLLTFSNRFAGPALMLPTVQFAKLAQQMEEKRKSLAHTEE